MDKKKIPKLRRINDQDIENLLKTVARNKAIAYDAASDILFDDYVSYNNSVDETSNLQKTATKLRNIWRVNLDEI